MSQETAENINILGAFCGKRDVEALSTECLHAKYGIEQADVLVLFGGSILCGGDILADAIQKGIAKKYIIVGGAGHTTETLRQKVHTSYPFVITDGLPEAEVFSRYIETIYGVHADYLETSSTNCGNNITYLLDLLKQNNIAFSNIIICQDATMQHRMEAGMRKYVSKDILIINYATYKAQVACIDGELTYQTSIHGMWDVDRYVNLLMGEIPRLSDDENGYGPKGKAFIAHVDIPKEVYQAFEELKKYYGGNIREANPLYASKEHGED